MQASLPDAVSGEELQEQTSRDPELTEMKSAIARGYLSKQKKKNSGTATVRPSLHRVSSSSSGGTGILRGARIVMPSALKDKVVGIAPMKDIRMSGRRRSISEPGFGFRI